MSGHTRWVAAAVFAGAAMSGLVLAQAGAPSPQGAPAPAGQQAPADQPAPGGRGRQGGAAQGGAPAPARRGGFTQFTRQLASQDVLVRGKSLYEANCASCHAVDLRGSATGPNLLRSGVALNDEHGELVAASVAKHIPALTLVTADTTAIAEYLHSIHATMGGQGSPGRGTANVTLNVLVGDARAGEALFTPLCSSCHSVTGNLKGIGTKYPDPRTLQNTWVSGQGGTFGGGGGRGGGGAGAPVTVTMADGSKLEGTLIRRDEFLVVLTLADGTRKSIARNNGIPKVDVKDPQEAHKGMVMKLIFDDPDNKKMHDITAYLATIK